MRLNKKYEVLLIILFLVFLLFLFSEGLLFVSFFWTTFHSFSFPTLEIWPGEGFYVPDLLTVDLFFGLFSFLMKSSFKKKVKRKAVEDIVCKVRTQDPENLDEEVKSLVSAWRFILGSPLTFHKYKIDSKQKMNENYEETYNGTAFRYPSTRHKQNSLILAQPNFIGNLIINRNVSFKRKEIVDKLLNHENLME